MEEKVFNNWALKKWSLIFSAETRFDPNSYLLTSLVPISFIKIFKGRKYVVADLEEIREHTPLALRGCKQLVDSGCAQWIEFKECPKEHSDKLEDCSTGILAIGMLKGFNSITYFMEETGQTSQEEFVEELVIEGEASTAETMQIIDRVFKTYQNYCERNGLHARAGQVYRQVKNLMSKARATKWNRTEFLEYLYLVNTIVYDLSDVPNVTKKFKELSTSTNIISQLTSEELIQIVPFFVLNYHTFAKKGYEETNIYNLSFHLKTILTRMRGTGGRKSARSNENDTL